MSTGDSSVKLLEVRGLTRRFGALTACDRIDLTIGKGEIHALLGENGAGKSTLVKMLFGLFEPHSGEILWKGKTVRITDSGVARRLGIGMVFQHFCLFDALTVAENIVLSLHDGESIAAIAVRAQELSRSYGLAIDAQALIGDLSAGERQRVEIIRCLMQNPELIILDEPTSVLTPQEADKLFVTLERLRDEGRSILYISHRLEEVMRVCDRATVLRHGKVAGECDPRQETAASLARMMVGGDVGQITREDGESRPAGEVLLEIRNLDRAAATPFSIPLRNINLAVHAGEVVGIAGVAGNGQSEFFEAVSGETLQKQAGSIRIRGKDCGRMDISQRRKLGAAFVPEERIGHATVPGMTLSQNLLLSRHATDGKAWLGRAETIRKRSLTAALQRITSALDVRKGAADPEAASLSGGNLQKFVIGRELDRQPAILVVNQPTWGVDAGAAARIRQSIIELARNGSAVLVISQDLDELFDISDRLAVMHKGELSPPVPRAETSFPDVGVLMGGAGLDSGRAAGVAA